MTLRTAVSIALTGLLVAAAPARATYHALEEIPVESPIYRMVDDLAASYGLGSSFLDTRPWDRADLGHFLDELVLNAPRAADDPLVVRLRRELAPAPVPGGWEPAWSGEDERTSIEVSPYARADYAEDRALRSVVRDFRGGVQGSAALGEEVLVFGDVFAGTQSPGGHGNPSSAGGFALDEGSDVHTYYDRGLAIWRGTLGRLEVGHTWLRWGPGAWSTMALSDAAPALDVAEARLPLLHVAQLEWFVATLDPASQSYLAGHRLELRPGPRVDLAIGELARFDGASNAPLYLLPVVPYSHIGKRVLDTSDVGADSLARLGANNVMGTLDGVWRWRPGVRLYGELAVDNLHFGSQPQPRQLAWQLGVDARRTVGGGAVAVRGEYARVYQYTYASADHLDFAYAGLPIGFELGPDADRLNARLEWQRDAAWTFGLEGSATRKGEGELGQYWLPGEPTNNLVLTGVLADDSRGAATVDWSPAPGLVAGVTAGYARVDGVDHVAGTSATGAYGSTRFTLRW